MKGLSSRLLPAYLLLCIVVGGSTQSAWGIAVLQLFAIALLAWAMLAPDTVPPPKAGKRLTILIGLLGLLFAVQLIPLPPAIWMAIPGREFVAHGFDLLGIPKPWLAASLAPYDTLSTALTLLPPLAIFVGMLRLRSWRISEMFAAVLLGAAIAIVLGALQLSKGQSWYLYEQTNLGIAVGTFANGNHFGTLMLVALPLFAAWTASGTRSATKPQQRAFATAMTVAVATMLAGGFLISRSVAVLLIAPAVAAATALMLFRWPKRRLRQGLAALGLLVVVAAGAVGFAGKYLPGWGTTASIETRKEYWSKTWHAAEEQWLTGSGFGTFQQDYRRYEDPSTINRFYVNHAHNDYAEIALEGGVPAILLVVLFLIWWGARSREAWLSPGAGVEQKAASIASAAILMHSAIDFPLRTAAIAAILAMCLGILSGARGTVKSSDDKKSRPARHATL